MDTEVWIFESLIREIMNWKSWLGKPAAVLSVLAVCTGLLVDYQGAASAIPTIAAFLPLIANGCVVSSQNGDEKGRSDTARTEAAIQRAEGRRLMLTKPA